MDEKMLKKTIDKALRLKREMTPGGWDWSACGLEAYTMEMGYVDGALVLDTDEKPPNPADAEAIADVPRLVDTVITLAERLAAAERQIARLLGHNNITITAPAEDAQTEQKLTGYHTGINWNPTREQLLRLLPDVNLSSQPWLNAAQRGLVPISINDLRLDKHSKVVRFWSKHNLRVFLQRDVGDFYEINHIETNEADNPFLYAGRLLPNMQEVHFLPWARVYVGGPGVFHLVLKPLLIEILDWESQTASGSFAFDSVREVRYGIGPLNFETIHIPLESMRAWLNHLADAKHSLLIGHEPSLKRRVEEAYYTCLVLYAEALKQPGQ